MAASIGVRSQLGIGASDPVDEVYEFVSEDFAMQQSLIAGHGIRGSRERVIDRVRQGLKTFSGSVVLEPTPTELRDLFPRCLGGAESGSGPYAYAVADTNPTFYMTIDRIAKVFTYTGCKVDQWSISSSPGQAMRLALNIEALTETIGNSGTFPSLTYDTGAPFVHHDTSGAVTIGGTAYECGQIQITGSNALKKDRFVNSQTRTELPETDREIRLSLMVPYTSSTVSLYNGGTSGVDVVITYTNGGLSVAYTFGKVIFPAAKSPTTGSKNDEIMLRLDGEALKSSSEPTISIALDVSA